MGSIFSAKSLYIFLLLDSILSHLTYPHTWVRLISSRLFGLLFSQHSPEDIATISKDSSPHEYLSLDITKKIASLCESFLEQLKSQHVDEDLGDQVRDKLLYAITKNMLKNTTSFLSFKRLSRICSI